tara:strand:+ start:172 stop:1254 length:1083 start_codon:yes stop_codon:yes gene_type:complete
MNKLNLYLFYTAMRFIFITLLIISILIIFFNTIEITRLLDNVEKDYINKFLYLSFLKLPTIINDILPFVIIISITFLFRYLINNNELISMRNVGYSIFDIFVPISISVFFIGLISLTFLNPLSTIFDKKFDEIINKNIENIYSIKISNQGMWIKNNINNEMLSYINIKNIDLKRMKANNIKILNNNNNEKKLILAEKGIFNNNIFVLYNTIVHDLKNNKINEIDKLDLNVNFNKDNIISSIINYKNVPFYKYLSHSKTLKKFNLYNSEIGLYYISEILKPVFMIMLAFVIVGFAGKFKRNENFFKVLFISISIGFFVFFLKEIITKLTISLDINFIISYLIIFFIPFSIGLYQMIKIEND